MTARVFVWSPAHPGDTSGLSCALDALAADRVERLAIFGKVEGPATLNDFSRDLAVLATEAVLRAHGGEALLARSWRLFSTGCEGVATPVVALIAEIGGRSAGDAPRLAFGAARSAPIPPEDLCGPGHIRAAAAAVRAAMAQAGLSADEVALALVKSPVLRGGADVPAERRRHVGSTGSSRGAAALGVGLALGEIAESALAVDPVGRGPSLHSRRAMAFSGTETDAVEAIVLGERPGAGGDMRIATAVLEDLLDAPGAARLAATSDAADRALLLFKAGIAPDGRLRGRRTTVFASDLPADKQLRAAASGAVGAWFGATDAFISGGAEHQGPPGACLAALIHRAGAA